MKCRVCGYEVEEGASHCPMCGTRVVSAADKPAEISWNTKDFPKPKEMEDIEMSWPDLNSFGHTTQVSEEKIEEALDKKEPLTVMSEDASEGYVSRPTPAEEKPPVKPYIPPMSKATMEVRTSNVPPEARPKDEPALPAYWYTQKFTATGIMQTGPAWPVAPGSTKPSFPTTATIETMTLSDPVPIAPSAQDETGGPGFTLEDILEEFGEPVTSPSEPSATRTFVNTRAQEPVHEAPAAPAEAAAPAAPRVSADTLQQKNEEFQRLLDREYDRLRVLHGEEPEGSSKSARFVPEEKVQAKDLSTFEKMLMQTAEPPVEKTPAQKFFTDPTEEEKSTSDPELTAFIAPAGDPSKYDINGIENTIRELQEQETIAESRRIERQKRLDAMTAAREAYYSNLEAEAAKASEKQETKAEKAPEEASVEDASPLDLGEDDEPTKEIPVGSILKALAAGGAVAALEKSMEIEKPAKAVVEPAAEIIEKAAEPSVKTAAMAATSLASISEDAGWTRVFRRSLTEEAEERAKIYEEKAEEAGDAAKHPIDAAEEIAKKYEAAFGHPAKEEEEERKSWTIGDPSVFAGIRETAAEQTEEDIKAAEARAAEALAASKAVGEQAEETAEQAAEAAEEAAEGVSEQIAETIEDTADEAVKAADSIDAKLAEAEKAIEEKLAEADAALSQKADAEEPEQAAQAPEEAETKPEVSPAGQAAALGADVEDAQARIAAAIAALKAGSPSAKPEEPETPAEAGPEIKTGSEAEPSEEVPAEEQPAEPASEGEPSEEAPAEDDSKEDVIASAFAESSEPSEPTHEFDVEDVKTKAEKQEEAEKEDDDTEVRSRHILLKIIAIILVICAIFEGAVWGLKRFAPEAQITENAVQIEQGVGDALVSLYNSIADGIRNLIGNN